VPFVLRTRASAVLVSVIAVLPLAACYQGAGRTVSNQGPTGNGTDFVVGSDLKVQDTTLVADPDRPSSAALIMTVINEGEADDALVSASIGTLRGATEGPVALPAGRAVRLGGPGGAPAIAFVDLPQQPGSYATVNLTFRKAGAAQAQVAIVPATGYYAGYGPSIDAEG
jgi:copper(I)-binding protein